jgi:hypothetical protein
MRRLGRGRIWCCGRRGCEGMWLRGVVESSMRWLACLKNRIDGGLILWWYNRLRSVRNAAMPLREYFSSTRLSLKQSVLDGDIIDFRVPKKKEMPLREHLSASRLSAERCSSCGSISDFDISRGTCVHRESASCRSTSHQESRLGAVVSSPPVHREHSYTIERVRPIDLTPSREPRFLWWYQQLYSINNL